MIPAFVMLVVLAMSAVGALLAGHRGDARGGFGWCVVLVVASVALISSLLLEVLAHA